MRGGQGERTGEGGQGKSPVLRVMAAMQIYAADPSARGPMQGADLVRADLEAAQGAVCPDVFFRKRQQGRAEAGELSLEVRQQGVVRLEMPGGEHDVQIAHSLPGQYLEKADARRRGSQQVHIVHDQHGGSGKVEALQQFQRRIASGRVIGRERRAEAAQRSRRFRRLGQTLQFPAQGTPEGAVRGIQHGNPDHG